MKLLKILFILATAFTVFTTPLCAQRKGDATYYGNKFHGRRTSDGSRYHKDSLTCAHRTLPFGTLLKVRNMKNGREVVVKVTDRGPFRRGGIVDLSMAAAREIDMVAQGVVRVEIEEIGHVNDRKPDHEVGNAYAEEVLPQMKYLDPATGEFRSMAEWKARGDEAQKQKIAPHYRVLNEKMTAKNIRVTHSTGK